MPGSALWVNGRDVVDFNAHVVQFSGALGEFTAGDREALVLAGRIGVGLSTPDPAIGLRKFVAQLWLLSASNAAITTDAQALLRWIGKRQVELRTLHQTDRVAFGQLVASSVEIVGRQGVSAQALVTLEFTCQPLYYERTFQTYHVHLTGQANRVFIPQGTGPSTLRLYVFGAATPIANPVITHRAFDGSILKQVTLTIASLSDNDYLLLDGDAMTVKKSLSGVVTDVPEVPNVGDPFFVLAPEYTDPEQGMWTSLETDKGTLLALIQRTWDL